MRLKQQIMSIAAGITLLGAGAGALATAGTASAATPSCGKDCVNVFNVGTGHRFVLDVYKQAQTVGQPVILFQGSNTDPAEDWTYSLQGTVAGFISAGLLPAALGVQYASDPAFELEYAPYGMDTGLCLGTGTAAVNNTKVSLQPCGVTGKTVWVVDENPNDVPPGNQFVAFSGSSLTFSHPQVLTYPASGYPTDKPRPQLFTYQLGRFASGPHQVDDNQRWYAIPGVLP